MSAIYSLIEVTQTKSILLLKRFTYMYVAFTITAFTMQLYLYTQIKFLAESSGGRLYSGF